MRRLTGGHRGPEAAGATLDVAFEEVDGALPLVGGVGAGVSRVVARGLVLQKLLRLLGPYAPVREHFPRNVQLHLRVHRVTAPAALQIIIPGTVIFTKG